MGFKIMNYAKESSRYNFFIFDIIITDSLIYNSLCDQKTIISNKKISDFLEMLWVNKSKNDIEEDSNSFYSLILNVLAQIRMNYKL